MMLLPPEGVEVSSQLGNKLTAQMLTIYVDEYYDRHGAWPADAWLNPGNAKMSDQLHDTGVAAVHFNRGVSLSEVWFSGKADQMPEEAESEFVCRACGERQPMPETPLSGHPGSLSKDA